MQTKYATTFAATEDRNAKISDILTPPFCCQNGCDNSVIITLTYRKNNIIYGKYKYSSTATENVNNFDTYNNLEQQNTEMTYVLNTMKIHYPGCRYVPKIAPENYATSNLDIATLQTQGYSTCGVCFK